MLLKTGTLFLRSRYMVVFNPRHALPRRWAVIGLTVHDYMDVGGRVTPGAVTEEVQLSALGQEAHMRDP